MPGGAVAGMPANQLAILKRILEIALERRDSYKIWVFGSRARGDFREYSDIDLLIESTPILTSAEKQALASQLEESDLAYKVDLVLPDEVYLPYRANIGSEKRILLEKAVYSS